MKRIKLITVITAISLLITSIVLSSCTQKEKQTIETDSDSVKDEEGVFETTSEVPAKDFNNYNFTFLNGNTSYTYRSMVSEEQTGEIMNDSIYLRNTAAEEKYNITIDEIISKNPQSDYHQAINSGDTDFDAALLRMEWAFPEVLENCAVNWNNIPALHLDKNYWVQGTIKSMSLMGNVYFAVGMFDVSHFESVRTFLFNKNMSGNLGLPSLYSIVKDGDWTLNMFYDYAKSAAIDLDSDGKWTSKDRYGLIGNSNVLCNTLMAGVGSILSISKDKNDCPYFDLDTEEHIDKLLTVSRFFETKDGFVYKENKQDIFKNGNALFMSCLFSEVSVLRDMDDDFGILPAPKYDDNQSEYINLGGSPFFTVIPITAEDLDRTGTILEALASESMGIIDKAYYDIVLKGKFSRDNESANMLDIIFSTLQYYHPLANSYLNSPLADKYIWNGRTDFASYFSSVKDKINADINEALDLYEKNIKE